ncbi:MAG: LON peptidase substrate-binding domain-containing protein [Methylocystis sp.]|nr:LON peptidase substrate-binding domain-containing protein [Methylocystis sp.]
MSLNKPYTSIAELPATLPVFPLSGALLLPRGELPLNIFEPRYVAMVDDAMRGDRMIGMIQPLDADDAASSASRLSTVGCAGRITRLAETGDGRYLITLTGVTRYATVEELDVETPYRQFRVAYDEFSSDLLPGAGEKAVDRESMVAMLRNFAECSKLEVDWPSIDAAPTETLVNALAMMCPFGANEKQALVEAKDLKTRAETLVTLARIDLAQRNGEQPQWH